MSQTLRLALPLILSNLTVPILGLTDTAVIGHLSNVSYLGALGIGVAIFNLLFWAFGFLRMGTTGLVSQSFGAKDKTQCMALLGQSLSLALIIAVTILILQKPIANIAFYFFDSTHQLDNFSKQFYAIRIWSLPAVLVNYVLIGWLIGIKNVRLPLLITACTNASAIVLDVIFVYFLDFKLAGVAFAGLISTYMGVMIGIVGLKFVFKKHQFKWHYYYLYHLNNMGKFFHVNKDIFIRTLCLIFSFTFFTYQSTQLGPLVIASNTLLLNFFTLAAYGLDGFANAAETLVGYALGRKDVRKYHQALKETCLWSLYIALGMTLIYLIFGSYLIDMLTSIPNVAKMAKQFLLLTAFLPLVSFLGFWLDGVFIGATKTKQMRQSMLVATIVFLGLFFLFKNLQNTGLWLALNGFMLTRGLIMLIHLKINDHRVN